jgi:inosose dehydratase
MAPPADATRVLDEIAASGFSGTELGDWGFMPTEPGPLRELLQARGLEMVGAFVPVPLARPREAEVGVETAVRTAELLAAISPDAFIVLADDNGSDPTRVARAGRIRAEHGLDEARMDQAAAIADRVAAAVHSQAGLRTVFHHHAAGYIETPAETVALLERTSPHHLGLCLDTGHWTFGGGDPVAALSELGDRVWHVHFKDCHPDITGHVHASEADYFSAVRQGVFCELGQGSVDFPALVEVLKRREYDGWIVVEQDVLPGMGSPLQSAVRNRGYLARLGL